jgi:hypothetical protein
LRSARAARLPLEPVVLSVVALEPDEPVPLAPMDDELPVEPLVDGLAELLVDGLVEELLPLEGLVDDEEPEAPIVLLLAGSDDVDGLALVLPEGLVLLELLEPEGEAPIVLDEPVEPWLAPVLGCVPPAVAPAPVPDAVPVAELPAVPPDEPPAEPPDWATA